MGQGQHYSSTDRHILEAIEQLEANSPLRKKKVLERTYLAVTRQDPYESI